MVEEYELTPQGKLYELEKELNELKKHPLGSTSAGKNLLYAVETLNENITRLIDIFKESAENLGSASAADSGDSQVSGKIDELIDQNKEIAEALITLADEIKEHKKAFTSMPDMAAPTPLPTVSAMPGTPQAMPALGALPTAGPPPFPGLDSSMPPMPDFGADLGSDFGSDLGMPGSPTAGPPLPPEKKKKRGLFGR